MLNELDEESDSTPTTIPTTPTTIATAKNSFVGSEGPIYTASSASFKSFIPYRGVSLNFQDEPLIYNDDQELEQ